MKKHLKIKLLNNEKILFRKIKFSGVNKVLNLINNRKAQEAGHGTAMPLQGNIEVFMTIAIGIIFLVFGAYLMQDERVALMYYSKDMSLLIDSLVLVDGNIQVHYVDNIRDMSKFDFEFDKNYATAKSYINKGAGSKTEIGKSYIHFYNPFVEQKGRKDATRPNELFFQKSQKNYEVSDTEKLLVHKSYCEKGDAVVELSSSVEEFYFHEVSDVYSDNDIFFNNPRYVLSSEKSFEAFNDARLKQIKNNGYSTLGIYIGLEKSLSNNKIIVYVPFHQMKGLGCSIYNHLIDNLKNDEVDIRLIPTTSIPQLAEGSNFTQAVYIDLSDTDKDAVKDAIKQTLENDIAWS